MGWGACPTDLLILLCLNVYVLCSCMQPKGKFLLFIECILFSVTGEQGYTAGLPWKALLEDVVPGLKDLARGLGEPYIS